MTNEAKRNEDTVEPLVRHGLTYDQTGTGHDRITCLCGKTIVRQPWMTDAVWRSRVHIFKRDNHGEPNAAVEARRNAVASDGLLADELEGGK